MGRSNKRRGKSKPFVMLDKSILRSKEFSDLSFKAVKLLLDVMEQYNGNNNGDMCVTMKVARDRGWKSPGTLHAAKNELVEKGWLELTRQGGRHKCSLFAVSLYPIDECGGKHEWRSTKKASNRWRSKN